MFYPSEGLIVRRPEKLTIVILLTLPQWKHLCLRSAPVSTSIVVDLLKN